MNNSEDRGQIYEKHDLQRFNIDFKPSQDKKKTNSSLNEGSQKQQVNILEQIDDKYLSHLQSKENHQKDMEFKSFFNEEQIPSVLKKNQENDQNSIDEVKRMLPDLFSNSKQNEPSEDQKQKEYHQLKIKKREKQLKLSKQAYFAQKLAQRQNKIMRIYNIYEEKQKILEIPMNNKEKQQKNKYSFDLAIKNQDKNDIVGLFSSQPRKRRNDDKISKIQDKNCGTNEQERKKIINEEIQYFRKRQQQRKKPKIQIQENEQLTENHKQKTTQLNHQKRIFFKIKQSMNEQNKPKIQIFTNTVACEVFTYILQGEDEKVFIKNEINTKKENKIQSFANNSRNQDHQKEKK